MTPAERLQSAIDKLNTIRNHLVALSALDKLAGYERHLNQTIDAQIAILQHTLERAHASIRSGAIERFVWSRDQDALHLADAILNRTALAVGDRISTESRTVERPPCGCSCHYDGGATKHIAPCCQPLTESQTGDDRG